MPPRITLIGAGSYTFGMSCLHDLILDHRLIEAELVLVDKDEELAAIMADVARRMAREEQVDIAIQSTADIPSSVEGAVAVINCAAPRDRTSQFQDHDIAGRHGIREPLGDCGTVSGISYALRTVPLVLSIAREMETHCPGAWLLNVTNPLPRVVGAVARYTTTNIIGFCNVAWGGPDGYRNVGELFGRDPGQLDILSGVLNHFSWLLRVKDRNTGEDLMPYVPGAVARGASWIGQVTRKCWETYGWLPLSGNSHLAEFLPPAFSEGETWTSHLGTNETRRVLREELRAVGAGEGDWRPFLEKRSWERPADVVASLIRNETRRLDMANVLNRGAIPQLADEAVVELPLLIQDGNVIPQGHDALPEELLPVVRRVSEIHTLTTEAAVNGDRALAHQIIEMDPAIEPKAAAHAALDEMIETKRDLLPQFA